MPSQNIPSLLGTFTDGQVVLAGSVPPSGFENNTLNPKMETIRSAINDHATRIDSLTAQVGALGGILYNVVAYGADPTGVADSTAAIQACISAAIGQQGIVIFSNGIYKLTDTITISGTCYISSDGAGQGVTIYQTTATKPIFNITSSYVRITDLKLDMRANPSSSSIITTTGTGFSGIIIQRCTFSASTGNTILAMTLQNTTGLAVTDCIVVGSSTQYHTLLKIYNCVSSLVSRNTVSYCYYAVYANGCSGLICEQNSVTNYKNYPVYFTSCFGAYLDKNSIKTSKDNSGNYSAIYVTGSNYVSITDNTLDESSATATTGRHTGIIIVGSDNTSIVKNSLLYHKYGISFETTASARFNIAFNSIAVCELYGINFAVCTGSGNITGNQFIDIYAAATQSKCIFFDTSTDTYNVTITGNYIGTVGSSATYVNTYAIYQTSGAYGTRIICASGNDFSKASGGSVVISADFSVFYPDATGRAIYNTTTAAPTTGTWKQGDKVILALPSASGYLGYVCTTAGTPGTWKGYGAIQA